jgi:hypothetical protein
MRGMTPMIIESCHSSWIFDTECGRFCRVLKEADIGPHQVVTPWRPYYALDLDPNSESFVVALNPEGTRLLRSWRHTGDCGQCGGHVTAELSLDDIQSLTRRNSLTAPAT